MSIPTQKSPSSSVGLKEEVVVGRTEEEIKDRNCGGGGRSQRFSGGESGFFFDIILK